MRSWSTDASCRFREVVGEEAALKEDLSPGDTLDEGLDGTMDLANTAAGLAAEARDRTNPVCPEQSWIGFSLPLEARFITSLASLVSGFSLGGAA